MTQPTNAELDRFMTIEVMGWSICGEGKNACYCKGAGHNYAHVSFNDWHPTADIALAIGCAEKWCDDTGGHYKLEGGIDGSGEFVYRAVLTKWNPRSQSHTRYTGEGTKELAICLALYEAMKGGKK